nr:MFS transporter [uncultured Devosia sp.]
MTSFFRSPTTHVVAALSITQIISWGATFNLPAVIGPAMGVDIGLPISAIMAGPTVMLVVMAAISWRLATIFERRGARPVMALGSLIGALGLTILALAANPIIYFLAWFILGLAGACMLTTAAQIAVKEISGPQARQALGALMLAGGLTSTLMWPVTGILQAQWTWRPTTLFYAAQLLVVCLPLHWLVLARHPRQPAAHAQTTARSRIDIPRFALLAATFAANGFVTWGFSLTIIILFEARGLTHADAIAAAALIGIAQLAARLVDFLGSKHWSGLATALVTSLLFPASFALLFFTNGFPMAALFACLYGLAGGATAVARATLPLEIFPSDAYARASARLAVPLNLSFAAAPPIFAAILSSAGAETALLLALGLSSFALLCLVALFLLQRRMA